jgi:hypothetical protein
MPQKVKERTNALISSEDSIEWFISAKCVIINNKDYIRKRWLLVLIHTAIQILKDANPTVPPQNSPNLEIPATHTAVVDLEMERKLKIFEQRRKLATSEYRGLSQAQKGIKLINDENVTNKMAADILQMGHRNLDRVRAAIEAGREPGRVVAPHQVVCTVVR